MSENGSDASNTPTQIDASVARALVVSGRRIPLAVRIFEALTGMDVTPDQLARRRDNIARNHLRRSKHSLTRFVTFVYLWPVFGRKSGMFMGLQERLSAFGSRFFSFYEIFERFRDYSHHNW